MDTVSKLARKIVLVPGDFPRDKLKILQGGTAPVGTGEKIKTGHGLDLLSPPQGFPPYFGSGMVKVDTN